MHVYDGNDRSNLLGTITGVVPRAIPYAQRFIASSQMLYVILTSDGSVNGEGFVAVFDGV